MFRLRMVRGGVYVAAKIGQTDEGLWFAEIDGKAAGEPRANPIENSAVMRIWTFGDAVQEREFDYLLARGEWARHHDPNHPAATPEVAVDLRRLPPLF